MQSRSRITDWLAPAKEFHARSGLSQRIVAEEADLDHSYVSRLLAGERNPERDVLIALGYAWRVTRADVDTLLLLAGFPPLGRSAFREYREFQVGKDGSPATSYRSISAPVSG